MELSVNIDHVATLREARKEPFPDPVQAAFEVILGGGDGITVHIRQDRRHIKERDLFLLKEVLTVPLNIEMAQVPEMKEIAIKVKPHQVTLVPERPEEVTTEGGLNLKSAPGIGDHIQELKDHGIRISIFVDPDLEQIRLAKELGAEVIEINTAAYSKSPDDVELSKIKRVAEAAFELGLVVHAGHGIDYHNIHGIKQIPQITGCSIGFAIIARAVFVGLRNAVREMKELMG
ncbi:pyridoxine 5'-phosphate synthase [candidate division WOR-3 bacterium]|uniref:Pyridoxine 5'-phosphate synthase n=1 Tax=candidate division WOR-3 bacterium TaxID=2052148 RepID=A0A660SLP4_UNCW3|nr:MAG: pyridoxine 5'-phosphate synthase [candidate division WOR-3 bacterium]